MKSFSHRYKIPLFIVFYTGLFVFVAVLSYFVASKRSELEHSKTSKAYSFATDFVYVDLPRISVSVNGGNDRVHMQIDLSLEVTKEDASILEGYRPRLVDQLNRFFGGLHPNQVTSARSLPWVRSEILKQVNHADLPIPVHAVWLQRFIVTQPPMAFSHLVIPVPAPTS